MPPQVHDRDLQQLYDRSPSRVAFVDEAFDEGAKPFYVMSAVIVDFGILEDTRDDLIEIAADAWPDRVYWHTSTALASDDADIIACAEELIRFVAESDAISVCAIDAEPEHFEDMEKLRAYTMHCLAMVLCKSHGVDVMVIERRRAGAEELADTQTLNKIRTTDGLRHLRVHQGTPSSEQLLWAPDLVASTLRRRISRGQPEWFEPLREKTSIFRAGSFEPIVLG